MITIHPLGTMKICTKFHENPSDSCWDLDHGGEPTDQMCSLCLILKKQVHLAKIWIIHHNPTELETCLPFNSHVWMYLNAVLHAVCYCIRSSVSHFGTLFQWKHSQSQCLGHRGCSIAATDGDFKPTAQIHTQALALIFLTLPLSNSASQMFSVTQLFLVSQPDLLAN